MRLTPRQQKFWNAPSDKIAQMLSDVSPEDPVIKIWDDRKDKDEKWVVQLRVTKITQKNNTVLLSPYLR